VDLAAPGHADQALGERIDDLLPVAAHAVYVDLGRAEGQANVFGIFGVGDELGGVQDCLGRDATDVQTRPAGSLARLNKSDLEAVIRREEGRRVTAGAAAEDEELSFSHGCWVVRWLGCWVVGVGSQSIRPREPPNHLTTQQPVRNARPSATDFPASQRS